MADGGHVEFRKMLVYPYLMKTFSQNLIQTRPRRNAQVTITKPEVNSRDVISLTSYVCYSQRLYETFKSNVGCGTRLEEQTTVMVERAKFTNHENPRGRRPPY